jgi:hypothetical protein
LVAWDQPVYEINLSSSLLEVLNKIPDLPGISFYELEPGHPTPGWLTLLRPPIVDNASLVVQEY